MAEKPVKRKSSTRQRIAQDPETKPTQEGANAKSLTEQLTVLKIGIPLAKYLGVALLIWVLGRFGFSYQWILLATLAVVFWMRNREKKNKKKSIGKAINNDEEKAVEARVEDMPSWVCVKCYCKSKIIMIILIKFR